MIRINKNGKNIYTLLKQLEVFNSQTAHCPRTHVENMLIENILILINVLAIVSTYQSVRDCLDYKKDVRYPYQQSISNKTICSSGSGSNRKHEVQIIEDEFTLTYVTCVITKDYLHVDKTTHYPIGKSLNFTAMLIGAFSGEDELKSPFQKCLHTFCHGDRRNRFLCYAPNVTSLEFQFNIVVTPICLQNITQAYISGKRFNNIRRNSFLNNAYNIIYLTFDFVTIQTIQCNAFQNLKLLRVLEFKIRFNTEVNRHKCFFQYNPLLVKAFMNGKWLWNRCPTKFEVNMVRLGNLDDNNSNVITWILSAVSLILALFALFLIGFLLRLFLKYRKTNITVNPVESVQMCRIYQGTSSDEQSNV